MRQTIKEIETNNAYRWYIGYGLNEDIPHFSTYSKNYERRFAGTDIFEQIFKKIIRKISSYGLLDESTVFIDGTHIKANANNHNYINVEVEKSTRYYETALQKEIAEDRKRHGKKEPKTKSEEEVELKNIKQSTVDPDCGVFHKGEHKKVFAYNANVACDNHNFILNFDLGPGNTHDSVMFPKLYHKLNSQFKNIKYLVMDAGYKTPAIIKEVIDNDQIPITPYKRPMTKKDYFKKYEFVYDEFNDEVICPNNEILTYATTNKDGYSQYKSNPQKCKNCPFLSKCTSSKNNVKVYSRHVWESYMEEAEEIRHTLKYRDKYSKRKETIERVFADAKEKHHMRYAKHRGIDNVTNELYLLFSAMNIKKMALALDKLTNPEFI